MTRRLVLVAFFFCSWTALRAEPPRLNSLREFVQKNQTRHAMGLYLQNTKVGWMIVDFRLGDHNGKEVAVETTEMLLSLAVDGERSVTRRREKVFYSLEGEGRILAAEQVDTTDDRSTLHSVIAQPDGRLSITTKVGKESNTRVIPPPKSTLSRVRDMMDWLTGPRKKGDTFRHWSADWEEDDVNTEEVITYLGRSFLAWGGIKTEIYHVQIEMKGARFEADVLANGNPVRGRVAIFELRAETEEVARKLDDQPVDMLVASSIKVDRPLGNSKQITRLSLEVEGVDSFVVPQNHRQKLSRDSGKTILELQSDFRIAQPVMLSAEEEKKYLSSTPTIQSDHEKLKTLASRIVGEEADPLRKAERIKNWVYQRLRKTMASNSSTALGVLDSLAGDCTEHTLLFVSLARAAGIPAREVTGVAHVDGLFGWHAWAEIHDGHQWVSVDPTWDELFVDATHIVFSQDSQDNAWLNVLGKVRFKVRSVERRSP
ncbi:MAG: transglutaminase-like domain-containing protein [Gemmataceae bacterium]|nr:transglutaminase-like domain-containing protein [Gemmataceae bacterium]